MSTSAAWQPVTFASQRAAKACGHTHQTRRGWVLDCNAPATFARVSEHGGHEYACSKHVHEMSEPS